MRSAHGAHLPRSRRRAGSAAVAVAALVIVLTVSASGARGATPARGGWRSSPVTTTSIAFNQGISFDPARGDFFFDGVSSAADSGLYRTDSNLVQTSANLAVIPPTAEGYNHAGDLSFDPLDRRVLLPLECYYPAAGGNTCGVGAIGVADPVSLSFLYYVNLATAQIQKAMWAEISPDGRWIWTSSGTHLLVYRSAEVSPATAAQQRAGSRGGITGKDLGPVLPASSVTGAAFYQDVFTRTPQLLLALNRGTYSEVISYATGTARDGSPTLLGGARSEITLPRSSSNDESEGLAVTGAGLARNPLGSVLDWLMLPVLGPGNFNSRILGYTRVPAPPRDGASVRLRQRLPGALAGLRLRVVCNDPCNVSASFAIPGQLARRLGLASAKATATSFVVGTSRLPLGHGIRTLTIVVRPRARAALGGVHTIKASVLVRSTYPFSGRSATYKLPLTLNR